MSAAGYNGPQWNYASGFKSQTEKPGLLTLSLVTLSTVTGIQEESSEPSVTHEHGGTDNDDKY